MPTRDEVLKDVLLRVQALEIDVSALGKRVSALESGDADPWSKPFEVEEEFTLGEAEPSKLQQEVDHVPERLRPASGIVRPSEAQTATGVTDPDEDTPEVLEAKRRIEEANATDLQPKLHLKEVQVMPGVNEVLVTVPAPSKQQIFMRKGNANRVIANLPNLDHDAATKAYIEGGPLWLHAFDRHHVVELPADLRQQFIRDLALTAPESAHELARDILKVTDPEVQSAWAHDNMEGMKQESERRGG